MEKYNNNLFNFNKAIKIGAIILMFSSFMSLFGCGSEKKETIDSSNKSSNSSSNSSKSISRIKKDSSHEVGYQLKMPEKGEEIAVMSTNMGKIKLRFFDDAAPKAVENFKTHSKNGYYNGLKFLRVIDNFMIQGGDPNGNGTGGKSIWETPFEDEFSDKLFNIRGSVAMANSGKDTNGSQFFINQTKSSSMQDFAILEKQLASSVDFSKVTDEIKKLYKENGGNIHLDGALSKQGKGHTVFAQVFDGMNVVDDIASVKVNGNDRPEKDVIINNIEILKFE